MKLGAAWLLLSAAAGVLCPAASCICTATATGLLFPWHVVRRDDPLSVRILVDAQKETTTPCSV
jgi:hypothetical protein